MKAMDYISFVQLDIDKNRTKFLKNTFKQNLQYLKERDKKVHKMHKSMVNVLSNLNMTTCHAFIEDWNLIPPPYTYSNIMTMNN